MYAKISVEFDCFAIFIFCYSTKGPYGTISFERPFKAIEAQVSDVPPWASCLNHHILFVFLNFFFHIESKDAKVFPFMILHKCMCNVHNDRYVMCIIPRTMLTSSC